MCSRQWREVGQPDRTFGEALVSGGSSGSKGRGNKVGESRLNGCFVDMDVISFSWSTAGWLYPHCKVDIMLMRISDSSSLSLSLTPNSVSDSIQPCMASYRAWDISSAGTAIISQKLFSVTRVQCEQRATRTTRTTGNGPLFYCYCCPDVLTAAASWLCGFTLSPSSSLHPSWATLVEDGHLAVLCSVYFML